jgi:hypothetical protein
MNSRKSPLYMLRQTCVLHLVGSLGHVVHYIASRTRIIDALFFLLWWDRYEFQKKPDVHVMPTLCFASGRISGSCSALRCI